MTVRNCKGMLLFRNTVLNIADHSLTLV